MTAWDELIRFSSLTEGDAWGHLTHQEGGGTGGTVILAASSGAGLASLPMTGEAVPASLVADFNLQTLSADATPAQLSGVVYQAGLAANLAPVDLVAGAMDAPTEGVIYGD